MKKKAILIGNTNGLNGVKIDLENFASFLKCDKGGAWLDREIEYIVDERKSSLLAKIDSIRKQSFDYVTVMFSGHGGQERQTILELNAHGEKIEETLLRQISKRQLNIYDCCRAYRPIVAKSQGFESFSEARLLDSTDIIRQRYDNRIMQAIEQQALLYSCKVGQVSYDTPTGGVYVSNLLASALVISSDQEFKQVGIAHQESVEPTLENSRKEKHGPQQPESFLPKCLSDQQLIISINDKKHNIWL